MKEELEVFAKLLPTFLECTEVEQQGVKDMAAILEDPEADEDDKQTALKTMEEAMKGPRYRALDELTALSEEMGLYE